MKRLYASIVFLRVEMWESVLWISTFPHAARSVELWESAFGISTVRRMVVTTRSILALLGIAGRPSIRALWVVVALSDNNGAS
jgi:hypothetical protein